VKDLRTHLNLGSERLLVRCLTRLLERRRLLVTETCLQQALVVIAPRRRDRERSPRRLERLLRLLHLRRPRVADELEEGHLMVRA
jgi:hypothetical protein